MRPSAPHGIAPPAIDAPRPPVTPPERPGLFHLLSKPAVLGAILGATSILALGIPQAHADTRAPASSHGTRFVHQAVRPSFAHAPASTLGLKARRAAFDRAREDLGRINTLKPAILAVARAKDIDPALLAGMLSRETRAGNTLDKNGKGDHGHGYGLLQINDRSHGEWLRTHDWRDPATNMTMAAEILFSFEAEIAERAAGAHLSPAAGDLLKWTISAYNAGPYPAVRGVIRRQSSDAYTTGHDYAGDILARAEFYRQNGFVLDPPASPSNLNPGTPPDSR